MQTTGIRFWNKNMDTLSIAIAFTAGIISFLSPCVLPIIPGFLAYLAGTGAEAERPQRYDVFLASVFFVLGFSAVFSAIGVLLNTILSSAAYGVQLWLGRIGGGIVILFGLYLTGVIPVPFLERQRTFRVRKTFASRHVTSFVFGAAFAAGWTPCVGAVLGGIFGLAASAPGSAFWLLFAYSLGLGIPFLLAGLFTAQTLHFVRRFGATFEYLRKAFGVVLIILGVLAFTQSLNRVANLELLNRWLLR